jgi:hypothetical protein
MKTQQYHCINNQLICTFTSPGFDLQKAQLVLAFGDVAIITQESFFQKLKDLFPNTDIVSSSSAGEIINDEVHEETVVITAIEFERTSFRWAIAKEKDFTDSYSIGKQLMTQLQTDDINSLFVLADGTHFNCSDLIDGFNEGNSRAIPITGGMAGDGIRFTQTAIGINALPEKGIVVAIGFYGNHLKVGHGSFGGWDQFGPEKTVTRSERDMIYEIDGKNPVDIYNEYLGGIKDELPMNALLFPLAVKRTGTNQPLIRTIMRMDEKEKTMQVAGNLSTGSRVQFMKANFEHLIDGSAIAATKSLVKLSNSTPELAIMISCVGRKLILQKRADEEVLAAKEVLGDSFPIMGFYSYGEFCPLNETPQCEHHNQTMIIITFSES